MTTPRGPSPLDLQPATGGGIVLPVQAHPGARQSGVIGVYDGRLKIAVNEAPEKGRANQAIIAVLAEVLCLKRSQIALLAGASGRRKKFLIRGLDEATLRSRFADIVAG